MRCEGCDGAGGPSKSCAGCNGTGTAKRTQADLDAAAARCHESCSDYSCVRSGGCTGHAGHAADAMRREAHAAEKQAEEDRALAASIARLRKAGALGGHCIQGPTESGISARYERELQERAKYALDQAQEFLRQLWGRT